MRAELQEILDSLTNGQKEQAREQMIELAHTGQLADLIAVYWHVIPDKAWYLLAVHLAKALEQETN